MTKKNYKWAEGATLDEHSKRKHKILKEYFRQYLLTRCKLPQQEKFRLAIVDGFAGAGLYSCGSYGSPLIFVETLINTFNEINVSRAAQGSRPIEIECSLVFNDLEQSAIEQLKQNISPLQAGIKENTPNLHIQIIYHNAEFGHIFPQIKSQLLAARYNNVIFNLDQCGTTHVNIGVVSDIMSSWKSAEIFLTFMIGSLLTFASADQNKDKALLKIPEIKEALALVLENGSLPLSKASWLGKVEQTIFGSLKERARFVSPFSIHNPEGWSYWLIHFANNHRARQVYNDILHGNSSHQAHFGRSGLNMLAYNPDHEGNLYLFDEDSRKLAKNALYDDIPRLISEYGDALTVDDFYSASYNETAAHSDDIHSMIMENPDIEVLTPQGKERRKAHTIKPTDVLKLRNQKSLFPMFLKTTS